MHPNRCAVCHMSLLAYSPGNLADSLPIVGRFKAVRSVLLGSLLDFLIKQMCQRSPLVHGSGDCVDWLLLRLVCHQQLATASACPPVKTVSELRDACCSSNARPEHQAPTEQSRRLTVSGSIASFLSKHNFLSSSNGRQKAPSTSPSSPAWQNGNSSLRELFSHLHAASCTQLVPNMCVMTTATAFHQLDLLSSYLAQGSSSGLLLC